MKLRDLEQGARLAFLICKMRLIKMICKTIALRGSLARVYERAMCLAQGLTHSKTSIFGSAFVSWDLSLGYLSLKLGVLSPRLLEDWVWLS